MGPNTDPCGTPDVIECHVAASPSSIQRILRPVTVLLHTRDVCASHQTEAFQTSHYTKTNHAKKWDNTERKGKEGKKGEELGNGTMHFA